MTDHQQPSSQPDAKPSSFSARLKSAREALGLERKDVAAQLRLNEKIILMMEKDKYPFDLPVTFIRGYLRSYSKLLQIPEFEVKTALENIRPKTQTAAPVLGTLLPLGEPANSNYFMQFFTYLILVTIAGLVAMWWYNHSSTSSPLTENQTMALNDTQYATENEPREMTVAQAAAPVVPPPLKADEKPLDTAKNIKDHKKPIVAMAASKPSIKQTESNIEEENTENDGEYETSSEHIETTSDEAD